VIVFGGQILNAVVLTGRNLNDISQANVGPTPLATQPPTGATSGASVDLYNGVHMGTFQESSLFDAVVTRSSSLEHLTFAGGAAQMSITGTGLTYDAGGALSGGTVTGVEVTSPAGHFVLAGAHTDGSVLGAAFHNNDPNLSISSLLSGNDIITVRGTTAPGADTTFTALGYGGNDLMIGGGSLSTLDGGTGDDTIQAGSATQTYLRGGDGNDSIVGGVGFDDINGNKGDDTIDGGAGPGNDWLVGGQGNDSITAHAGQNLLYGNLGDDTLHGGNGGDVLRGGQGADSIVGGSGNDFISGDRGNDTEVGGLGADIFHTSQDAGIDKVLDFSQSQGDRVQLDPGTTFTLSQSGADTIIDLGNGNEMILVGVQLASLTPGWIFGA
jgi:Ca2+-binding RTX toxin-like protein